MSQETGYYTYTTYTTFSNKKLNPQGKKILHIQMHLH